MIKWLIKKTTKQYTKVPLLYITFNLKQYKEYGAKDSCEVKLHPSLKFDDYLTKHLGEIIDYIRENYDMDKLSK